MTKDLKPNQIALFFWQTYPNGKEDAKRRLASISPKFSSPEVISRIWSEQWEVKKDIYGSLWIISGPGTLVMPKTTAYRVSLSIGKWSMFENTGNRPIHIKSMKDHYGLRAEDMDHVSPRDVPGDVLVIAMLSVLGE